jgi:hypothetical protein
MAPWSASAQDVAATQMALNHGDFAPRSADEISFVHRFGTCLATRQHPDVLSLLPRSDKSKDQLFGVATMSSGCGTWGEGVFAAIEGNLKGNAYSWLYNNIEDCVSRISFAGAWVGKLNFDPAVVKGEVFRSIVLDGWASEPRKSFSRNSGGLRTYHGTLPLIR